MDSTETHAVTRLIEAADRGDACATEQLLEVAYDELRKLAQAWMQKQAPGQTLQGTALVHEAYIRLVGKEVGGWETSRHFFFAASRAMHDVLVERARAKMRDKRGGGRKRVDFSGLTVAAEAPEEDLLALNEVLEQFRTEHAAEYDVVLLRFFGGLTAEQAAGVLNTSLRTVERQWRFARAWLQKRLSSEPAE